MQSSDAAKTLLEQQSYGVLSTHSVDVPGFPFGSLIPYSLTPDYHPLIYISNIAQHTKNITADNRVALTVLEKTPTDASDNLAATDPQTRGRVTIIGHAQPVPMETPDGKMLHKRYFQQFPDAEATLSNLGFYLYQIQPVRLRYIGGFGKIAWLEPKQLTES